MLRLTAQDKEWMVSQLGTLVRIPSISFPDFDHREITRSAEATAALLKSTGFQKVEILQIDNCFPYVLAEYLVDSKLPTVLLYAHHDVQPPGREELWKTPPFEPTLINGRLYGRGTADDKAGILVHAGALRLLLSKAKFDPNFKIPVNIKVIIEGEEEVGSDHLLSFLKKYEERLKTDAIIVTDTANHDSGLPSMTMSLRGLVVTEVEVKSLKAPLHSGMWGGGVIDPVQVLVKMLSSLTDDAGNILLKSCQPKNKASAASQTKDVPFDAAYVGEQAGVLKPEGIQPHFWQRIWFEPSLSINAIQASSEKLANNVICDRAYARVGIRVTEDQNAEEVHEELLAALKSKAPKGVELKFRSQPPAGAWKMDPYSKENRWAFSAAEKALQWGYDRAPIYVGCGATIPFIAPFSEALKAPVITLGVEDPYTLAHSENESLLLSDLYKTTESEAYLFELLGAAKTEQR